MPSPEYPAILFLDPCGPPASLYWALHLPVALRTRRYCLLVHSVLEEGISSREPVLHLPVALGTRRYCFLVHSVLGESISYALTMPMPREPVLHLPVALGTRRYCFLVHSALGEGISYGLAMPWPCLCLGNRSCTYQWP